MLLSDGQSYHIHHGDVIPLMFEKMPARSVDFVVTSPPFPAMFAYNNSEADIGNSEDETESKIHLSWFFRGLARVLKPGRAACIHCMQLPLLKRSGRAGVSDFRGLLIRCGLRAGLTFDFDWLISKNAQALRNGSRVLTPHGWVPIDGLVIGSDVIGATGKPTKVVGVHPQGVRPMYRVKFSDGASVDCDGRHLWTVWTVSAWNNNKAPVVLSTEKLAEQHLFMPSGAARFNIPIMTGPAELSGQEELPLHPYLLGALLGDGMLSSRGTVGICSQRDIVERLPLPAGHRVRKLPGSDKGNTVADYHILGPEWHRNDVVAAIRSLGLDGKRAWEKFIPEQYLFANEESRRELVAGILDTDGRVTWKGCPNFHTTSEQLMEGFQFLVESLGGICTASRKRGGKYTIASGEVRTGRDMWAIMPRLRDGICPFRFGEKVDGWRASKKRIKRSVVSVERIEDAPCTCITVEADDGLFATERHVLTHNSQAIRNKSWQLKFQGIETDRAMCRGALGDYVLKFRAPGENTVPVVGEGQVSRNDWIDWADGCWDDIVETDTLNYQEGRAEEDTKHICPLQLQVIERCVRLYTNPNEIVFDPFMGVGSTAYVCLGGTSPKTKRRLHDNRRVYGCELKDKYHATALANCLRAEKQAKESQRTLFDALPEPDTDTVFEAAEEAPVAGPVMPCGHPDTPENNVRNIGCVLCDSGARPLAKAPDPWEDERREQREADRKAEAAMDGVGLNGAPVEEAPPKNFLCGHPDSADNRSEQGTCLKCEQMMASPAKPKRKYVRKNKTTSGKDPATTPDLAAQDVALSAEMAPAVEERQRQAEAADREVVPDPAEAPKHRQPAPGDRVRFTAGTGISTGIVMGITDEKPPRARVQFDDPPNAQVYRDMASLTLIDPGAVPVAVPAKPRARGLFEEDT